MRWLPHKLLFLVLVVLFIPTSLLGKELKRYRWPATEGAAYYQGVVKGEKKVVRMRTRGLELYLPPEADLNLRAYDKTGKLLGKVKLSSEVVSVKKVPKQIFVTPEDDIEIDESDLLGEDLVFDEEDYEDTPDQGYDSSRSIIPQPLVIEIDESPEEFDALFALGMGSEQITASGGASDYSGKSAVGGSLARGLWDLPRSKWLLLGEFEGHNYADVDGKEKYLRLRLHTVFAYEYDQALKIEEETRFKTGVGLAYISGPGFALADDITKLGGLEKQNDFGPYLRIDYGRKVAPRDWVLGTLGFMPFGLKNSVSNELLLQVNWQRSFQERFYFFTGFTHLRQNLAKDINCGEATNCTSLGQAKSITNQLLFGLGWHEPKSSF